jgi:hypothetical protein
MKKYSTHSILATCVGKQNQNMKIKLSRGLIVFCLAVLLAPLGVYGQNGSINANAKATFVTSYTALLGPYQASTSGPGQITSPWTTVLYQELKTANNWDLMVQPSFEVGLLTQTTVQSKNMVSDTSTATGSVKVRVRVDGNIIAPGEVTYGRRTQTLTATLEGAIGGCLTNVVTTNSAGGIVVITTVNTNCVLPEVIGLLDDSVSANSYTFVAPAVGTGVHEIIVEAQCAAMGDNQTGSFTAAALMGKGTLTVESSRLAKGGDPWVLGQ